MMRRLLAAITDYGEETWAGAAALINAAIVSLWVALAVGTWVHHHAVYWIGLVFVPVHTFVGWGYAVEWMRGCRHPADDPPEGDAGGDGEPPAMA